MDNENKRFQNCLAEFLGCLDESRDLHDCVQTINNIGCWRECISQLYDRSCAPKLGGALLSFWMTYGHHSIPRGLKDDLPIFIDALRYHLPAYEGLGRTLYRGEVEERHRREVYGIAWTDSPGVASKFADNRRTAREGNGVVLKIEATMDMIVVDHTSLKGPRVDIEREYIIDPRMIRSAEIIPRAEIVDADTVQF